MKIEASRIRPKMTTPEFTHEFMEHLNKVQAENQVDEPTMSAYLARVPASWTMRKRVPEGGAVFQRGDVQVIVSPMTYDGALWIHASACGRPSPSRWRLPSWDEMKRLKRDFFGADAWAYQVFPPESKYINENPYVLHLFGLLEGGSALPDFTRGLGLL